VRVLTKVFRKRLCCLRLGACGVGSGDPQLPRAPPRLPTNAYPRTLPIRDTAVRRRASHRRLPHRASGRGVPSACPSRPAGRPARPRSRGPTDED